MNIDDTEPFVLVGLSFGGILANEVLEFVKPQKTILISSVVIRTELPWYYRLAGTLSLNKLLPSRSANRGNFLMYWLFGLKDQFEKQLLNEILTTTNTEFTKWAINAITIWNRKVKQEGIIRIHGDNDRVLPITNFQPDYIIKGGGHLMVMNRAEEISDILRKQLLL